MFSAMQWKDFSNLNIDKAKMSPFDFFVLQKTVGTFIDRGGRCEINMI